MKVLKIELLDNEQVLLSTQLHTTLTLEQLLRLLPTLVNAAPEKPLIPSAGKYQRLSEHLTQSNQTEEMLTFQQIETLLGFNLPQSAYKHRAWWSNTLQGHTQAAAWLQVGWKVMKVDEGKVHFIREQEAR
ncbi:DUF7662 domain-containing protein [Deinococcus roseus]|uniref:DUF7662 domain-containing protein n=1 Tax=Deinococcus roseus TaxID=392414 RepID=A0ABQ2DJZ7_9DEIO|nr:hypothetical protein [Deinococcus roseus]GGJ59793.1 hypothetical protein GCM10008938_52400 [Deinococcus roseus]